MKTPVALLAVGGFAVLAASLAIHPTQASPSPTTTIIPVQPAATWTIQQPAGGNPLITSIQDVSTSNGPGVRTDASGNTDQFCECAHAVRVFKLPAPASSNSATISFYYQAGETGDYATVEMAITLMCGGMTVGRRTMASQPPISATGCEPINAMITDNAVTTLDLQSILGSDKLFDSIQVDLEHYGCITTSFQVLSDLTLTAEQLTPSQVIQFLQARVGGLPGDSSVKAKLLTELQTALGFTDLGQNLFNSGDFFNAQKEFNKGANTLKAFARTVKGNAKVLLAAGGPGFPNLLICDAGAGEAEAATAGRNKDNFVVEVPKQGFPGWRGIDLERVSRTDGGAPELDFTIPNGIRVSPLTLLSSFSVPGTLISVDALDGNIPQSTTDVHGVDLTDVSSLFSHAKLIIGSGCPNMEAIPVVTDFSLIIETEPGDPNPGTDHFGFAPGILPARDIGVPQTAVLDNTEKAFLDIPAVHDLNTTRFTTPPNPPRQALKYTQTRGFKTYLRWKTPHQPDVVVVVVWETSEVLHLKIQTKDTVGLASGMVTAIRSATQNDLNDLDAAEKKAKLDLKKIQHLP